MNEFLAGAGVALIGALLGWGLTFATDYWRGRRRVRTAARVIFSELTTNLNQLYIFRVHAKWVAGGPSRKAWDDHRAEVIGKLDLRAFGLIHNAYVGLDTVEPPKHLADAEETSPLWRSLIDLTIRKSEAAAVSLGRLAGVPDPELRVATLRENAKRNGYLDSGDSDESQDTGAGETDDRAHAEGSGRGDA